MPRLSYTTCMKSIDIKELLQNLGMNYMENTEIAVIVSHFARTNAYARIYGLPKAIQVGHSLSPKYTIEIICENIRKLDCEQIVIVFIHELLHIPRTVSGGLRPHGKNVNNRLARKLSRNLSQTDKKTLCNKIRECCK